MMKTNLIIIILGLIFIASCGKKDDQPQQQNQADSLRKADSLKKASDDQKKADSLKKAADDQKKTDDQKSADQKKADSLKKAADDKKKADQRKADSLKKVENKQPDSNPTSDIDFAPIFQKRCMKCHGKDGKGKIDNAPDFTSSKTKNKSEAQLVKIITNGVKADNPDDDDMPSFKGKLTDDEIKAAAKYVKSF